MHIDIPFPILATICVCAVAFLYVYLYVYKKETFYSQKKQTTERFEEADPAFVKNVDVSAETPYIGTPKANDSIEDEQYRAVDYESEQGPYNKRDTNTVQDLLPKDAANSLWAKNSPSPPGDVSDQNYLTAASLVGINTQGSSMRNANLQLRADPPITRSFTGIWNQSTIDPDLTRKDLC